MSLLATVATSKNVNPEALRKWRDDNLVELVLARARVSSRFRSRLLGELRSIGGGKRGPDPAASDRAVFRAVVYASVHHAKDLIDKKTGKKLGVTKACENIGKMYSKSGRTIERIYYSERNAERPRSIRKPLSNK